MGYSPKNSNPLGIQRCQSLFKLISKEINDLELIEHETGYAFKLQGADSSYQLCWIDLFKTYQKIKIWPAFDWRNVEILKDFVGTTGLTVTPRNKISKTSGSNFPLPVTIWTSEDIEKAAKVLQFAYVTKSEADTDVTKTPKGKIGGNASQYQLLADELPEPHLFPEGGRRAIIVNAYERSDQARKECILHHKVSCVVCGFNFEQRYGKLGEGFIHVHHIVEISKIGKKYEVDPKKDLCPVCPNCHAMLHRGDKVLDIAELKALLVQCQ